MSEEFEAELGSESFADDEGESSDKWQELPPEREFFASPYDPPIKSLIQEMREGELDARPPFQRNQVWNNARKSKFVESILLSIPIPTLFFAEDSDGKKVVVDGQQRLLALKDFSENKYALTSLKVLAGLNGKRHDDLTERQQRIIANRTLRCLVISAKSDSDIRFEVFERLNQGGVALNEQEVRHCVFRGPMNDLLHTLSKNPEWLRLYGRDRPHPRMLDCELILRFFALRSKLPDYSPPLKKVLNSYMESAKNINDSHPQELTRLFLSALKNVEAVFPQHPFRRANSQGAGIAFDRNINRAVFDVQMQFFADLDFEWCAKSAEAIRGRFIYLCMHDSRFADSLTRATADRSRMNYRLRTWALSLQELGAELPNTDLIPAELQEGNEKTGYDEA